MNWHIGWGLTHICNLRCKHCYNSSGNIQKDEISFKDAKENVDKLVEGGIKTINYGTGECDLLPYFWDLVKYIYSKKIIQGLTTNGYSVSLRTINNIKKYMNDVDVSLDFPDQERHNQFRGKKEAWKWAIDALELLRDNNVSFSIVTCINAENASKDIIDKFIEICRKYGCEWRINWYKPTGRGIKNEGLKLKPEIVYNLFRYIIENTDIVALPDPFFAALLHLDQKKGCPCGKTSFRITPSGKIVPCVYLTREQKIASLKETKFDDILSSPLFYEINNRILDECKDCLFIKTCQGGCATRAYLEYGTMNAPDAFCFKKMGLKTNPLENVKYTLAPKEMKVHEEYLCTMIVRPKK